MQSLKAERKARSNPRAKTGRKQARSGREMAPPAFGKRAQFRDGVFSRLFRRVARLFSRPMLLMALSVMLFVLVGALLVSGTVGRSANAIQRGLEAVAADSGFGISEIHLAGNARVPPATILAALGMEPGQSIFAANLGQARTRIMALDWIASADVVRRYPDAIFVNIVEKRPFALWYSPAFNGKGGVAVVERGGGVITTKGVDKFTRLPKLAGAGAPGAAADLVEAVMAHRALAARVALYQRQSERRWNLLLNDGVLVKLPEIGWRKQLDALEHLVIDNGILERDVTEIDLRSPTHYFFVLKGGEKKDVQRGKET